MDGRMRSGSPWSWGKEGKSALMGRNRFDELEQEAFWQAVEEALSSETTCVSRACDLNRRLSPRRD
jgi:hypothetical protein